MDNRHWLLLTLIAVFVLGSGAWWLTHEPDVVEVADEVPPEETGMSDEAQQELMRSIGYVQQ